MRFEGNRSLRNLKFYFEIKIFSQFKDSDLVGGLTPPPWGQILLGVVTFQDGCLSKELISTSKTNGCTTYVKQFESKLSIFFIFNTLILL